MKIIIKKIYMLFFHPYIFFKFTIKNNLFIRRRANIKESNKMKIGKNVSFGYDTRINFFNKQNSIQLEIEDNCYFGSRISLIIGGKIQIEKNVLVASDVCIISENHSIKPDIDIPYKDQDILCENVYIGEGTWIGEKVIILPGVRIGKKCVIGAGSVVTKGCPDYCMVAGNPAKVIKKYNFEAKKWERVDK